MKTIHGNEASVRSLRIILGLAISLALSGAKAQAGIAYGSINNFDTVNDTGVPCHGFEIELDDIHSADITYTYDWNHYGTPKITEDTTTVPGHTIVHVRYEAVWTNTAWSAYTAVPSGPIPATQGHQFTNPSTNFGGEHFGVGFRVQPTTVKYNWLIDDGAHGLMLGPSVNVSTPTFTYFPPVPAVAPAQLQAAIRPPPAPIYNEFGDATWVKEIRTTSHTNAEVKLRNLVSPDPDNPKRKDWRNGEPDEVEIEWQILQIDTMAGNGGANGELVGAAERLNHGDEIVTRRYEFYEYTGPFDPENHEALAQNVSTNGTNGTGSYSNTVVVGKYLGSQMAAAAGVAPLGLIDHLPDGEAGSVYADRTVVIAGDTNFSIATSGMLPDGMDFDPATGKVFGTPWTDGVFTFHVEVSSSNSPVVAKTYIFPVAPAGVALPPHSSVDTTAAPLQGGTTTGEGVYTNGDTATVTAQPAPGFGFVNWTENDVPVSTAATYQFTVGLNQSLVANFVPVPRLVFSPPQTNSLLFAWPTNFNNFSLQVNSNLNSTNWVTLSNGLNVKGTNNQMRIFPLSGNKFFRLLGR